MEFIRKEKDNINDNEVKNTNEENLIEIKDKNKNDSIKENEEKNDMNKIKKKKKIKKI